MLSKEAINELEQQQYRVIGSHSAVKVCGWTKNMIRDLGGCYKLKFYGIMSNQCLQMTTSISCANRCTFCWRGYKAPVSKEWEWNVDEPNEIIDKSIEAHHNLLVGFKGSREANKKVYENSKTVKHVALSLTGEPIIYPKINEIIKEFHKRKISTFLVTNAQYPEQIKNLEPVTQLYISLDAPNKKLLKEIDVPLFKDYWERLNKSLKYMAEKKYRTCIRVTIMKNLNDVEPENYAKLINKGNPDFIEVKAYMHVGESQKRLKRENMPLHEYMVEFSKKLVKHMPDYEIASEHIPSRVVMLAKKSFKKNGKWHTWINFRKFHEMFEEGKEIITEEFLRVTPQTGLSGKGTKDLIRKRKEKQEIDLE
ncbi:4-demethylwyosine synthase TYW1 [Bacteroidota bacterium]